MADKAQEHGETRADADADIALIAENARKADDGEGEDIIKQKRADQHRRRKAPAQNAVHRDAERKLNDRLDERGHFRPNIMETIAHGSMESSVTEPPNGICTTFTRLSTAPSATMMAHTASL